MNRLQAQAAALAVVSLVFLFALIFAFRAAEHSFTIPQSAPPAAQSNQPKSTMPPTAAPDRVILTWKGDPATTQAVTWRTDPSVKTAYAQIALADPGPGVEAGWKGYSSKKDGTFTARTEPFKTPSVEANYHSVNFEGLQPATRYMYRVGDGKNWSEWFQFDTASAAPEPFGFIYFGDAQNGIKTLWSRVARAAYSDLPKAKFILHAGDLVDRGESDDEWGQWHTASGWINGMVPSVPTPGNHEYAGRLTPYWRPQFTLPENGPPGLEETCYYLDFQGTRIVSLNSNERVAEQVPWLEEVLAKRPPGIRWTVVTFHHPLYSTSPGRDNKAVRQAWRPVFDKYGVDLVLQGHDHTYGRSGLMREDKLLSAEQAGKVRGTIYAVSVSGAKLYPLDKLSWAVRSAGDIQLYQLIRIDGDRLKYEARTARGDVFDAFELRKRPDGGNDLAEEKVPPFPAPDKPSWPEPPEFPVRKAPTEPPARPSAETLAGETDESGRGIVAGVILGSVVLGVVAAIRGARRKPPGA